MTIPRIIPMEFSESFNILFTVYNKHLVVEAYGKMDCYSAFIDATRRIYEKVFENNIKFLLLDFQNANLQMDWPDSFNLVRMYEKSMPVFAEVVAACTFNPESYKFAKYWHEICQKRGFNVHLFQSRLEAEKWLSERISQSA